MDAGVAYCFKTSFRTRRVSSVSGNANATPSSVALGVGIGPIVSLAFGRVIATELWGVSAYDPLTLRLNLQARRAALARIFHFRPQVLIR
ncbi:MAG: hypothetical protein DMG85_02600 [Acidobacteria bacterium]|nr:MAG: hypothetical protein DMG85_02600 [Acidobacteriota bacterium]